MTTTDLNKLIAFDPSYTTFKEIFSECRAEHLWNKYNALNRNLLYLLRRECNEEEIQEVLKYIGVQEDEEYEKRYYAPSDTMEKYDPETDSFYNVFGQKLRNPREYDTRSEGYTPFGDE